MKKLISVLLILALVLGLSAAAFADDLDGYVVPAKDKDLEKVKKPKDVSVVDSDWVTPVDPELVALKSLVLIPEALKTQARKQIATLKAGNWIILSGFGVWTEKEDKSFCTIKLGVKDVPDDAVIFVNGNAIQPSLKEKDKGEDGYYYFDVPLDTNLEKSVVLIARRSSSPDVPPYYPSPVNP